jgi:hypothetical protein
MLFSVANHHCGAWNIGLNLDGYGLLRHDHRAASGCGQDRIKFDSHTGSDNHRIRTIPKLHGYLLATHFCSD